MLFVTRGASEHLCIQRENIWKGQDEEIEFSTIQNNTGDTTFE